MKTIPRASNLDAAVEAPPSKSLSVRALLLAAMAEGETTVLNPLDADDTRYAVDALRKIGFAVEGSFRDGLRIGPRVTMSANEVELFVGNAGTAMRFLTGWLAFVPGRFILRGDARMHERPIGELVDSLRMLETEVEYLEREGFPPIVLRGRRMRGGIEVEIEGDRSSQFVSSLMMAGATLPDGIAIRVTSLSSRPYVDLTAGILREFGATVQEDEPDLFRVRGPLLRRDPYPVEGDWSSASYWVAAPLAAGGSVTIRGLRLDSDQGDRRILEIVEAMGASIERAADRITVRRTGPLRGGTFDCNATPDLVPTLAAIAPLAGTPVELTRIGTLRIKESDRIAVLARELRKLGARVDEQHDSLRIHPGWEAGPATIDPEGDHRIAMAFAVAGLARGGVSIDHEQVVGKSYPRFWKILDEVAATGR
ncbi:MAG TPA: 3-phosphoshikimate 1-carboxyvinyltransferase [Thermoanaerobaculia bacterium]|nr:3-phosphoshikimate 1-carboxyvinyltransferase [Thermoanaerobaculia bacterium]